MTEAKPEFSHSESYVTENGDEDVDVDVDEGDGPHQNRVSRMVPPADGMDAL